MNFLIHSLLLLTVNTATNTLLFVLDPLLSHNFFSSSRKSQIDSSSSSHNYSSNSNSSSSSRSRSRNYQKSSENNNNSRLRLTCSFFLSTHINRNNLRISIFSPPPFKIYTTPTLILLPYI